MTPQEYCRQQAAASGSSFYYSFLFLPVAQREAMMALYAFCRAVDDVVDTVQDPSVAASKLAWWRSEIERLFDKNPNFPVTHPIALALAAPCEAFGLSVVHFKEVIAGMEMDLHQHRYADDEALAVYCYRAAGVVGLLSARIFANGEDACREYALHLGQALQRINILRDVGEDALRGRVYLPQTLLAQHGLSTADILARKPSAALNAALAAFAAQAKNELNAALDALPAPHVRAQRAGLIMGRVYASLMAEIIHSDFAVLNQRISLTPIKKLGLAWKSWVAPQSAVRALRKLAL